MKELYSRDLEPIHNLSIRKDEYGVFIVLASPHMDELCLAALSKADARAIRNKLTKLLDTGVFG